MFIVVRTYVFINDAQRLCDHNGPREVQTKPRQVCFHVRIRPIHYMFNPPETGGLSNPCLPPATEEDYQIQVPLVPDAHLFSL